MIWLFILLILPVTAFFLAKFSLRDYLDYPGPGYGYFLIQPHSLNTQLLKKLSDQKALFSLERVVKGHTKAYILYLPTSVATALSELNLREIEAYEGSINAHSSLIGEISAPDLVSASLVPDIELKDQEFLFIQLVLRGDQFGAFQTNARFVISSSEPSRRVELFKKVSLQLSERGFKISPKTTKLYQKFSKRGLAPKQIKKSALNSDQIIKLLGL